MKSVRQSSIGQRVVRIFCDGLLEIVDCFPHIVVCEFFPVIPALQIQVVGFPIFRFVGGQFFLVFRAKPQLQFLGNVADNFLLYGGRIGNWAIVLRAPDLRAIAGINQFRLQVDAVAMVDQGPDQDGPDIQIAAHGLRIGAFRPYSGTPCCAT